jgi:hypothetical protein
MAADGDSILIHISFGLNVDTFKQADIVEVVTMDYNPLSKNKEWSGWLCCGKRCEGYKIDYYNDGKVRMEGLFRNGKPIGQLKFYNNEGKLKYVEFYNKRGKKIKSENVRI